ncbi:hypothetical protein [Mycobacterium sp. PS03-16]|nr:hypothetical protein [Mycobacterium sp. PS03-16]
MSADVPTILAIRAVSETDRAGADFVDADGEHRLPVRRLSDSQ